jgi:hypothetical protein
MTLQVLFNTETKAILQWQNTEAFGYPSLNEGDAVLEVTEEQFNSEERTTFLTVLDGELSTLEPDEPVRAPVPYDSMRRVSYPPIVDLADGIVKQQSGDPALVALGDAQVAAYVAACLAVKATFPKP